MDKSESIENLAKSLIKVQSKLKGARQDSKNPFFNSKYADLSSVWEACRGLLAENELAVIQTTDIGENHQLVVETILVHSSGEWISGQIPMILAKQDPQGIGSAITYGRRYGLSAIVGICPEDDDAESAMNRPDSSAKPKAIIPKPKPQDTKTKILMEVFALATEKGYSPELARSIMIREFEVAESKDLTLAQTKKFLKLLQDNDYTAEAHEQSNLTEEPKQ